MEQYRSHKEGKFVMVSMSSAQFDAMFREGKEVSLSEKIAMKTLLNTLVSMAFEHRKYGTLIEVSTTRYKDLDVDRELVIRLADILAVRLNEIKKKLNGGEELVAVEEE
jgi:hypothetical protein